ncbi:MAG: alanine racemase, partial [Verrucomicrobiota bacterium]|nr:alanine racemase [Verrucomicrobiota bacterium]
LPGLRLDGMFSHFSMSDELDKSFAREQIRRFLGVSDAVQQAGLTVGCRHLCNSGGFLDLPEAHLDMVRIGLLPLGVYPSQVCRRIDGIEPVGTLKTRLAVVRDVRRGDNVGYGLRYQAPVDMRVGVLPIGYGDGYPRVRNEGFVLLNSRRAPIIGANAMDSTMIDVTGISGATAWDEVVLMGRQGGDKITAHDLADWKGTVSYEVLTALRSRLPRVYHQ